MKPCWHGSVETLLPLLSLSPRLQEPTEWWSRPSALTVTSVGLNTSMSAHKAGRSQYLQPFKSNANRVVLQFLNYSADGGSCAMLCNTTLPTSKGFANCCNHMSRCLPFNCQFLAETNQVVGLSQWRNHHHQHDQTLASSQQTCCFKVGGRCTKKTLLKPLHPAGKSEM